MAINRRRMRRIERKISRNPAIEPQFGVMVFRYGKEGIDFCYPYPDPETKEEAEFFVKHVTITMENFLIEKGVYNWPEQLKPYKDDLQSVTKAYYIHKFELYELLNE